jgi:hypothetical protein
MPWQIVTPAPGIDYRYFRVTGWASTLDFATLPSPFLTISFLISQNSANELDKQTACEIG